MKTNRNLIQLCLLAALLLPALTASATQRTVTSLNDSGAGTLRDTIAASVANDSIVFNVSGPIMLTSGELPIGRNLTITGPGATNLTVSGNGSNRVFNITAGTVNISGLTIFAGHAVGTNGISFGSAGSAVGGDGLGGGILNNGTLALVNCDLDRRFDHLRRSCCWDQRHQFWVGWKCGRRRRPRRRNSEQRHAGAGQLLSGWQHRPRRRWRTAWHRPGRQWRRGQRGRHFQLWNSGAHRLHVLQKHRHWGHRRQRNLLRRSIRGRRPKQIGRAQDREIQK